jgi:hypothetical protein
MEIAALDGDGANKRISGKNAAKSLPARDRRVNLPSGRPPFGAA